MIKARTKYNHIKEIFEKLDYKIILDKGNFNTGFCLLEKERIVVINKNKPYENRIKILSEILSTLDLNGIFIKPYIRELITK